MKISFLCFDLSDNALGRAALLAQALARHHDVEILGPSRNGEIWKPMRDLGVPVKIFPWKRWPAFFAVLEELSRSIDGDVIYACKLRATSFGAALWHRFRSASAGKKIIVDIDDWELGFFLHSGFWGTLGRAFNLSNPNGLPGTWLMEKLAGRADAVTVSNRFLQQRFSGELVYHCRDTSALDPARLDGGRVRRALGIEDKKIVMFLGTPRAHKGVEDLLRAFAKIRRADAHLVLVGNDDAARWMSVAGVDLGGRITAVGQVPFAELGGYLAAADVVAVPQRRTSDTVGQLPAKLFDAMALAKPIVTTRVGDIPEVIGGCGWIVEPGDVTALAGALEEALSQEDEARERGRRARERCVRLYDIKVLEETLLRVVRRALDGDVKR